MGKYTNRNASIVGKGMGGKKNFFANIEKLKSIAEEIMKIVEESIPYDTGNLMDSTGVGIYVNGVLHDFRYSQQATVPQTYHKKKVWGKDTLDKAFSLGSSMYRDGVWIVIFSTVPYAGYQDKLSGYFSGIMKNNLQYFVLSHFKLSKQ